MIYNVIQPTAAKFEWGDETAIGDAEWWAGLKEWITGGTTLAERYACVGKKKLVSLSTAVLGANAATMVCIGVDRDGTGTMAFQTLGTLPNATVFGSSAAWIGSTARTICQRFYNRCSAKASIKTVKKGTCPDTNINRQGKVTYTNETVWLPSAFEMGAYDSWPPISESNSTKTNAECTYGFKNKYGYYSNNFGQRAIKYKMNAKGAVTTTIAYSYWLRSRCYDPSYSNQVCIVFYEGEAYGGDIEPYDASDIYLAPAFVIG